MGDLPRGDPTRLAIDRWCPHARDQGQSYSTFLWNNLVASGTIKGAIAQPTVRLVTGYGRLIRLEAQQGPAWVSPGAAGRRCRRARPDLGLQVCALPSRALGPGPVTPCTARPRPAASPRPGPLGAGAAGGARLRAERSRAEPSRARAGREGQGGRTAREIPRGPPSCQVSGPLPRRRLLRGWRPAPPAPARLGGAARGPGLGAGGRELGAAGTGSRQERADNGAGGAARLGLSRRVPGAQTWFLLVLDAVPVPVAVWPALGGSCPGAADPSPPRLSARSPWRCALVFFPQTSETRGSPFSFLFSNPKVSLGLSPSGLPQGWQRKVLPVRQCQDRRRREIFQLKNHRVARNGAQRQRRSPL